MHKECAGVGVPGGGPLITFVVEIALKESASKCDYPL